LAVRVGAVGGVEGAQVAVRVAVGLALGRVGECEDGFVLAVTGVADVGEEFDCAVESSEDPVKGFGVVV
jgi:hypothetical protein